MALSRRDWLKLVGAGAAASFLGRPARAASAAKPNLLYILADDLGYGDLACLNPEGKLPTPNYDRAAREGMIFTDAHSGSAVCTPTRYGILTGRYCFRSRLKSGVLMGDSEPLIQPSRMTVASLLREHGYHTACFGKWHLGLGWTKRAPLPDHEGLAWDLDYSRPFTGGPTELGFDEFSGISASLDMPPFAWLEGDHVVGTPSVTKKWLRAGAATPEFEAVDVLPGLTRRTISFLEARAKSDQPWFCYLPLNAPHTPILPTEEFQGKSKTTAYGDFVVQVDHSIGEVLGALEQTGQAENTLVILTSDNGCSPAAGFAALEQFGHDPSAQFRGMKADIFEGGHRVPFIARWPGVIEGGSTCDDVICLTDLLRTCGDVLGIKLPDNAGEDSVSILPNLIGTATAPVREAVVHHSINGSFSIRKGQWKLELCPGSGGWSHPRPGKDEVSGLPPIQLYDLTRDVGERRNEMSAYPGVVGELVALLEQFARDGRSTPGAPQPNEGQVDVWRGVPKEMRAGLR